MYPYKQELIGGAKAFALAIGCVMTPIICISYLNHWINPPAIEVTK